MTERRGLDGVKCPCGHVNPPGTLICEACGRPLDDDDGLLNMRYEGAARRSQQKPRTIVDHLWRFFASVKVAVWMIVIALIASIIGTILPQEQFKQSSLPPEIFYPQTYGLIGEIYYRLGFHNLYYSWWFIALLLMIGISLVVCSIDRAVPLYKALKKKRLPTDPGFFRRQRLFAAVEAPEDAVDRLRAAFARRRFQLTEGKGTLLAEKGRISRWGPYVNHVGLILLILAFMLRLIPGFYLDDYVWVWDGETRAVPGTPYYVKNERFDVTFYTEADFPDPKAFRPGIVKEYATHLVLYRKDGDRLVEVARGTTRVNHPFEYEGLYLYQSGEQVGELYGLVLDVWDKQKNASVGQIHLSLYDPPEVVDAGGGYRVRVLEYYPDLRINEKGEPYSESPRPNRPAFILEITGPGVEAGEKNWVIAGVDSDTILPDKRFKYKLAGFDLRNRSGLSVRIDRGLPAVYAASAIVVLGLFMGFYFQHRRIWIRREGETLLVAAHTNKNWFGLKKELVGLFREAGLPLDEAAIEQRRKTR
ncbi:MAG: cytochrome c biogenesis protein ResB [Hydrogenibacillus schlegelii]|uniref:Cytochrome c biogenesis protein ResB n=1 Tax=Hydrogenibacillus schlegelii TaxID=1484 RepID=A0A947CVN0_HYDSH|nr:cytochrome c biogenesis protein ResB [Hydrogenibacillus schlegelii]